MTENERIVANAKAGDPAAQEMVALSFEAAKQPQEAAGWMSRAAAGGNAYAALLQAVNEPDGLAKALIQTVEYRAATPGKLEEILFYDHPSVSWRIHNAMEWKAGHPPAANPPVAEPAH